MAKSRERGKRARTPREGTVYCPECGTGNPPDAENCLVCLIELSEEVRRRGYEERSQAKRRHPSGTRIPKKKIGTQAETAEQVEIDEPVTARHRAEDVRLFEKIKGRLSHKPEPDPDAKVWRGKISPVEQVERTLPSWSYSWINRRRVAFVALGAIVLLLIGYWTFRPEPPEKSPGELGLTFRYPEEWTDVSGNPDWASNFTTAWSDLDAGGVVDLAISRGSAAMAVIVMPATTETITADDLRNELSTAELLYRLSTDSRVDGIREVRIMGETGYSITAQRIFAGTRRTEEVVVLLKNGRIVHVLMSGASDRWEQERAAMAQVLR